MGISYDPPEDNKAWAEMMSFEFPLLSDPDRSIADSLDVSRQPPHPLFALPRRVTYLIDPEGVVAEAYDVGRNIQGHGQEVLETLRALAGPGS